MNKLFTLVCVAVATVLVGMCTFNVHMDIKSYHNAIRYAEEHNIKCYATGPNSVYVFSDYSMIGKYPMYEMYK